jgi:hypothetical protein
MAATRYAHAPPRAPIPEKTSIEPTTKAEVLCATTDIPATPARSADLSRFSNRKAEELKSMAVVSTAISSIPSSVGLDIHEITVLAAKVSAASTSLIRSTWRSSAFTRSGVRDASRVNSVITPMSATTVKSNVKDIAYV